MIFPESDLIKITLDMPIRDEFCYDAEETVGDFLKALGRHGGFFFNHKGIDYYLDSLNGCSDFSELAFHVNTEGVPGVPKYIQLFTDKKEHYFNFIQYAKFLDGKYLYEDIIDWERVKEYETFKPSWE